MNKAVKIRGGGATVSLFPCTVSVGSTPSRFVADSGWGCFFRPIRNHPPQNPNMMSAVRPSQWESTGRSMRARVEHARRWLEDREGEMQGWMGGAGGGGSGQTHRRLLIRQCHPACPEWFPGIAAAVFQVQSSAGPFHRLQIAIVRFT